MATRVTRESLLEDVVSRVAVVDEWESRAARARQELAEAEAASGEALVSQPSLLEKLAKQMQGARDEIAMSERALESARAQVEQARRRVLEFDALAFDRTADAAQARLTKHRERTAELLAALEEHEGRFVPERVWVYAARAAGMADAPLELELPVSVGLEDAVERDLLRAAVLRDVAAGVDPAPQIQEAMGIADSVFGLTREEFYPPAVWGPDAVIPAPAFLSAVDRGRRLLSGLDAKVAQTRQEIERREAEAVDLEGQVPSGPGVRLSQHEDGLKRRAETQRRSIEKHSEWLETGEPRERADLLAELEALTGERLVHESAPVSEHALEAVAS